MGRRISGGHKTIELELHYEIGCREYTVVIDAYNDSDPESGPEIQVCENVVGIWYHENGPGERDRIVIPWDVFVVLWGYEQLSLKMTKTYTDPDKVEELLMRELRNAAQLYVADQDEGGSW